MKTQIVRLASDWHSGQTSALYSLASTGRIASVSHALDLVRECREPELAPVARAAQSVVDRFDRRFFPESPTWPLVLRNAKEIHRCRETAETVCERLGLWEISGRLPCLRADVAMDYSDHVMEGFGVEHVEGSELDAYWRTTRLLYVNMGDPYDATLLFDPQLDRFLLGSWGDYVERYGRRLGVE